MKEWKKRFLYILPCLALGLFVWTQRTPEASFGKYRGHAGRDVSSFEEKTSVERKQKEKRIEVQRPPETSHRGLSAQKRSTGSRNFFEDLKSSRPSRFLEMKKKLGSNDKPHKRSKGDFSNGRGEAFSLVENLSALEPGRAEGYDEETEILNGFYLVSGSAAPGRSLPVVKNEETGNYAVFTKVIKAKLKDFSYEFEIARDSDGDIAESFEHINTVFYRYESYEKTLEALGAIRKRPEVIRAEIEVLENRRQPR